MDDQILDEEIDPDDVETPDEEELEEELDDELDADVVLGDGDDDDVVAVVAVDEDEDEDEPPAARRKPAGDEDEDEDEDVDPDDVEADLDAILKDRIAAGTDDDEDEEETPEDRNDPDVTERVAAKSAEEFTCSTCFMIVHPRQFGRMGSLVCPEGYDPCPSVALVEKRLKKAAKK
jgi:hypothetical protein